MHCVKGKPVALIVNEIGEVGIDGQVVTGRQSGDRKAMARIVQIVFQDPYSSLNPRMTVRDIVGEAWGGKYRGQTQKWYALRFTGEESEIDIAHPAGGHKPEFAEWRWEPLANIPELVVPFKRPVYERVATEFARFASNARR